MLAYLFWHRPDAGVEVVAYEEGQRAFHSSLDMPSASFRVDELPFESGIDGYEDWYLVGDWPDLGKLNLAAVDPLRRGDHDRVASMSAEGWGAVYELLRGQAEIPDGTSWLDKPRGRPYGEFVASLSQATIWQRQMVLGPAPEFCAFAPASPARVRIWPSGR